MNAILIAVRRARRRMFLAEILRVLPVAFFWAGLAAIPLLGVHRAVHALPAFLWPALPAGALATSLIVAAVRRPSLRTAALALDQAIGLEERVSAALFVGGDGSPAADAVRRDAEEAVRRAAGQGIALKRPRLLKPAIAALLVMGVLLLPVPARNAGGSSSAGAADSSAVVPEPVRKEESARLRRRAFSLEKRAEELKNPEFKELAGEMRQISEELRKEQTTKNEALAKISSLEEKARKQKDELTAKIPHSMLERIKNSGSDSTKSDLKKAELEKKLQALEKAAESLKDQLKDGAKTPEDRKKLDEALKKLADALGSDFGKESPFSDLEKKLEDLLAKGDSADLGELGKDLGDLDEALKNLDALNFLDDELADLAKSKDEFSDEDGTCYFCGKRMRGQKGGT